MEYVIGAGAILEAGASATITPATLHARVDPSLAAQVRVAAIDFEGASLDDVRKLIVIVAGWNATGFRQRISAKLLEMVECSLADILILLATEAQTRELHVFANWMPDAATTEALATHGLSIVSHPLESIESAALVAGQRHRRWKAVRAA